MWRKHSNNTSIVYSILNLGPSRCSPDFLESWIWAHQGAQQNFFNLESGPNKELTRLSSILNLDPSCYWTYSHIRTILGLNLTFQHLLISENFRRLSNFSSIYFWVSRCWHFHGNVVLNRSIWRMKLNQNIFFKNILTPINPSFKMLNLWWPNENLNISLINKCEREIIKFPFSLQKLNFKTKI